MSARGRKARMTPTKLLIGQILVVLAIIVASIWAATQWAAAQLAHQPELGTPWFVLLDQPIYHPWSVFPWWFSFDAYAPVIFDQRSEEHTSELQSLMRTSYAVFCLKKKNTNNNHRLENNNKQNINRRRIRQK